MVVIKDRTFVISGGASGLGRGTAIELVKAGSYVAIFDMDGKAGADVVNQLGEDKCRFQKTDVGDSRSIAASIKATFEWIETTKANIGGALCAAGIGGQTYAIDADGNCDMDMFDRVMRVNVRGSWDLACQLVPYWLKVDATISPENPDGDRGAIILVSSIAAFEGQSGMSAYAGSKACIQGITLPLAKDLAKHSIRAVNIAPGHFDSAMTGRLPQKMVESNLAAIEFPKRGGQPREFALFVKHIYENVYLNATSLRIDGGMRMPQTPWTGTH